MSVDVKRPVTVSYERCESERVQPSIPARTPQDLEGISGSAWRPDLFGSDALEVHVDRVTVVPDVQLGFAPLLDLFDLHARFLPIPCN